MSWARRRARRWSALWVVLLAGAPVRAQDAQVPQAHEAAPATAVDHAETLAPPSPSVAPGHPATVVGPVPDEHRHSDFFFHADLGGGYFRVSGSRGGSSFATEGGALGVGLALGWSPNDEWAIGLELWSWKSLADSALGKDTSVELQALGLNLTRYLVPADVFASVVVSGTRLAITDPGDHIEYGGSDIGFGFKVLLGKEWRLNSWLGLGLAGELFLSVNRDGGQTLRTLGGGLFFSFTGR